MAQDKINLRARQANLRKKYEENPQAAWITHRAATRGDNLSDPFHGAVKAGVGEGPFLEYGVDESVGGLSDMPSPGDILCASLAACLESSIRMVASSFGVGLTALAVEVSAEVDVRGTLGIDMEAPVGFQTIHCQVKMQVAQGTDQRIADKMTAVAERSCKVLQTLQAGAAVESDFQVSGTSEGGKE